MKKTFTDEQIVGILRGFEASGKTIKGHFTNGAAASGRWKLPRLKNIGNCSRKTRD